MMNRQKAGEEEEKEKMAHHHYQNHTTPSPPLAHFSSRTSPMPYFNSTSPRYLSTCSSISLARASQGSASSLQLSSWESASSRSQVRYSRESLGLGESSCLARS